MTFLSGTMVIQEETFGGKQHFVPCLIPVEEIRMIQGFSDGVQVVLKNNDTVVLSENIKDIEKRLREAG